MTTRPGMQANALLLVGFVVLIAGIVIRVSGDRSTGGAVLLAGAAILILSRVFRSRPPR